MWRLSHAPWSPYATYLPPFSFTHSTHGPLHRYVHVSGEAGLVTGTNWHVLTGGWPDDGETPWLRHAVNNNNTEEVAVYLGFLWRLTEGRSRYAIPAYFRDEAARALGKGCLFVDWEYEVDATEPDPERRDEGFVPARACVPIRPRPTAFQREHRAHAGLFHLESYDELVAATRATLSDASAEVSLFAVGDDRRDALVDALRRSRRPQLADVLDVGDLFVDLTIGVDLGYSDSLIIYSRTDIGEWLDTLTSAYEAAIEAYERRVPRTRTVGEMLRELDRLAAGRR